MGRPRIAPQKAPPKMPRDRYDPTVIDRALADQHQRIAELESRTDLSGSVVSSLSALSGTVGSAIAAVPGRYLNRQVISTSQDYIPTSGTVSILVKMVGGGGGGGPATSAAGQACAASGGGGGVYWERYFSKLTSVTGSVSVGAAVGPFTVGNDTSFAINGTTYLAKGGPRGAAGVSTAGNANVMPGAIQAGTSAGDVTSWQPGGVGIVMDGGAWWSGYGGGSPFGAGGTANGGNSNGTNGTGNGAGGAGGASALGAFGAGGSGSAGLCMVDEFGTG